MPTYERGDMWSVFGNTDLFMITTNPIRRLDGAVVMGRGIAKQAKDRFPQLPYDFGHKVEPGSRVGLIGEYEGQMVGFFMVKDHWRNAADPGIIRESALALASCMQYTDPVTGERRLSDKRVDMNFPGIGNGRLRREDVLPLLEHLPDNVHVWEYGS